MNKAILASLLVLCLGVASAAELPLADEHPRILQSAEAEESFQEFPEPEPASTGFANLFNDASLTLSSTYYGRARSADNRNRAGAADAGEIHVNAFGQRVDLRSGYAWGIVGFDVGGQTNLGRGNGWSEVLLHREPGNKDRSSAALSQAALKFKIGSEDLALEARGGFTPISIGSLGTSGGLFSHSYRGFESRVRYKDFSFGYGWADRFRNEWDDTYRQMYSTWSQNRFGDTSGRRITYVHSLGARYEFGRDKAGFVDVGVGEGHRFRRNAQAVASVPFDLGRFGVLTVTGYGIVAKYRELFSAEPKNTEYHVSGMAQLAKGRWTFMAGMGHTSAPDSEEMQFRLTAWGSSDNRNYIQTWGQLDDFVWDGQNVVKVGFKYGLGDKICLPGLSVGASFNYAWNGKNGAGRDRIAAREIDYMVEYTVQKGALKGLSLGVYAGHLRWNGNDFYGKQNRNDVKVIVSYSRTLEGLLRSR